LNLPPGVAEVCRQGADEREELLLRVALRVKLRDWLRFVLILVDGREFIHV